MTFEGRRRYIPEELQEQIQVRLPTKSFIRLESVCKAWQSRFADLYHFLRGRSNLPYRISKKHVLSMVPELANPPPPSATWSLMQHDTVLGSGILCLISLHRSFFPPPSISISSAKFALLNPVTGNFILTNPIPTTESSFSSIFPLSDPSEVFFGFGTHNSDYKIVVLIRYGPNFASSVVLLYSLLSGKWKKTKSVIPQETRISYIYGGNSGRGRVLLRDCFVSGCWHWLTMLNDGTYRVLSFNFGDQEFRLIGMPKPLELIFPKYHENVTFVLQERLAVIETVCMGAHVERLQVSVMVEYGAEESWTRVYTVDLPFMYGIVEYYIRVDCRKGAMAAAGFVVGNLFFKARMESGDYESICCDDDGCRVVDGIRNVVVDELRVDGEGKNQVLNEQERDKEDTKSVEDEGCHGRAGKRTRKRKQRR